VIGSGRPASNLGPQAQVELVRPAAKPAAARGFQQLHTARLWAEPKVINHRASRGGGEEYTICTAVGTRDVLDRPRPAADHVLADGSSVGPWPAAYASSWPRGGGRRGGMVFRDLALARIIEPTSKLDSARVLEEAGIAPASYPRSPRGHPRGVLRTRQSGNPSLRNGPG